MAILALPSLPEGPRTDRFPTLKIAILTTQVGAPGTLASTALIGTITDGLHQIEVGAKVVGLTRTPGAWRPESLGDCASSSPWIDPPACTERDRAYAIAAGILVPTELGDEALPESNDWYRELLLERELEGFAGEDPDLRLMVYPRSAMFIQLALRIARRHDWSVLAFATEQPSERPAEIAAAEAYTSAVGREANGICAVSEQLADYWAQHGVEATHIAVIPTPVRSACFAEAEPHVPGTMVVYVGNLEHGQVDYLFDVASTAVHRIPMLTLKLYGDATEDRRIELLAESQRRGLGQVVEFLAPVSPVEIPQVLQTADVLVVPPRDYGQCTTGGFPMKLGECLASGVPVVTTTMGDIPKYLVDGESAFLVPPQDTDAFAAAVVKLLEHPELAARMGAEGRAVAQRDLAAPAVAAQIRDFLLSLPTPIALREGESQGHGVPTSGDRDVALVREGRPTFRPIGRSRDTDRGHAATPARPTARDSISVS